MTVRLHWRPPGRGDLYGLFLPEHLGYPGSAAAVSAHAESQVRAALGNDFAVHNRGNRLEIVPRLPNPSHTLVSLAVRAALARPVDLLVNATDSPSGRPAA